LNQPVPVELIAKMARYQAKWNQENIKPKPRKSSGKIVGQ
jgi:hypothetical protein